MKTDTMKTDTLEKINFEHIAKNEERAEEFRLHCFRHVRETGPPALLSAGRANVKLRKSAREDLRIVSLSLAHGSESGLNVCPSSTAECRALCVGSTGLASVWPTIQAARIRKTLFIMENRAAAIVQLIGELEHERQIAERDGCLLLCRLNCFSDLPIESASFGMIPQMFIGCGMTGAGGLIFYDYTAILSRVSNPQRPANYSLCGSWKGHPKSILGCHELLTAGHNVAVPFAQEGAYWGNRALMQELPKTFRILSDQFNVHDGDESDIRAFDPGPRSDGKGNVIGLRFKSANNQNRSFGLNSDFVVRVE